MPLPKVNNWEPVKKQPRSLAVKPPGAGSKRPLPDKEPAPAAAAPSAAPDKKQAVATAALRKPASKQPLSRPSKPATPAIAAAPTKKAPGPAAKQLTLQPMRRPAAAAPAARDPDPPPEPEDEEGEAQEEAQGHEQEAPIAYDASRASVVDAEQSQLFVRLLNGRERCAHETQRITHVYEGVNTPRGNNVFLLQKIALPTSCSEYKVTVEYTLPAKQSGARHCGSS